MDMPGVMKHPDLARIVAVCDLDSVRVNDGKQLVESTYAKALGSASAMNVKTYGNYREMLQDPSIDAIAISLPDHWHALPAIEGALAGKFRHPAVAPHLRAVQRQFPQIEWLVRGR